MRDTSAMDTDDLPARKVTRRDDFGRYELDVGGEVVSFAVFSESDERVTIPHVETAVSHRGNGYSSLLLDGVVDDLRARHRHVRATCPVARAHIAERAPELLVR